MTRKFLTWIISLAAVLTAYLLYNSFSNTPMIKLESGVGPITAIIDSNSGQQPEVGKVGDIGVGTVEKAKYTRLDKNKRVEREFGFERLLHAMEDEWEIEKPFMNIYRPGLTCYLTADNGRVQVEDAGGKPNPKDAELTGNVVIHILPDDSEKTKESFIYLDDVTFISERSLFTTAGPIKFVSANAQMLGKGMELVYDEELDRLDFFRIMDLETLKLKSTEGQLFSSQQKETGEPTAVDSGGQESGSVSAAGESEQEPIYRCSLMENVFIDSPEQVIAADEVSISNILFGGVSSSSSDKSADRGGQDKPPSSSGGSGEIKSEPNQPAGGEFDTIITCDGGILVAPMDWAGWANEGREAKGSGSGMEPAKKLLAKLAGEKPSFLAEKINYDVFTEDVVATGAAELTFYASDMMDDTGQGKPTPVTVTATEKTRFSPGDHEVVFTGDSVCRMVSGDANLVKEYTLKAPVLTIDLYKYEDKESGEEPEVNIEHMRADGGVVRLASIEKTGDEVIGGIELKCQRFDYDTYEQLFTATGPGLIKVRNSGSGETQQRAGKLSLQRPCYATVRDFETLTYLQGEQVIVADGGLGGVLVDYFPLTNGQYSEQVSVVTNRIEIKLDEAVEGKSDISTATASGGIVYDDGNQEFAGSNLFYDHSKQLMSLWGDQGCYLNGAAVNNIEYDLKTGKVKANIVGPGLLQLDR